MACTSTSPSRTPADVSASVRRCAASPSSAGDPVRRARRWMYELTNRLATSENATTPIPKPRRSTLAPTARRRIASKAMTPDPTRMSIPSIAAERFSIFSWP